MKDALDIGELSRTLPSVESLLALLAFEREGDMVRAARSLGLTQPALSFQLKRLEESVGFALFSFTGKRKVLTKVGQAYVEELKSSVLGLHLLHQKFSKAATDLDHQKLRIAGRRELFIPFLPFPFPGQVELIQTSSVEALRSLREHRVDLAVSAQIIDSGDLVAKLFFESGFKLITPRKWKTDPSDAEALHHRPVVVYGNHHAYLDEYLSWKGWKFGDLNVARIVEDWFSVVELVRYGFGWAIIPEGWEPHTQDVLVQDLGVQSIPKQKIFLFHRREDRKSPWVESLDRWLSSRKP